MILNPDKCHFMVLGNKENNFDFICGDHIIKSTNAEKILGILIDKNLSFTQHLDQICKVAGQKLNAISRISSFINQDH